MTMKKIYLAEAFAQCCMCGEPGLSTTEGDGGTECQLDDGRWTCSHECWDRAIDPTPALGWLAAREAVERIAHNADCNGHFGAAEALFALRAALRAALDAAEADKRQAVDALSSLVEASDVTVGKWLSAAQDDKDVCAEMKDDIKVWFDALDAAIREGVSHIAKETGKLPASQDVCKKCGGAGWLWGPELDDYSPPHPGQSDDTRYSCDGVDCYALSRLQQKE